MPPRRISGVVGRDLTHSRIPNLNGIVDSKKFHPLRKRDL